MTGAPAIESSWGDEYRVAVIIVNYCTADLTIACVESVRRSAGVHPRIVVVDNASNDDSAASLRAAFGALPEVTLDFCALPRGPITRVGAASGQADCR